MPEALLSTGFTPESLVGSVIDGRYRLVAHLATGGMGAVFRAEHVYMNKPLALKVLRPDLTTSPEIAERFRREAQIAASLEHENIVRVTDFGKSPEGYLFLAMELLEGESLFERLRDGKFLRPEDAVPLLQQICSALQAAHAIGVVHRDLKPENIFLTRNADGRTIAKILDFGIAKITDPSVGSATQTGLVVGTPEYLAPEQAMGLAVDARADLYAVGLIAWRMLGGRHPFKADEPRQLLMMQATRPVPPITEGRPELAEWPALVATVLRCCAKSPAERHPDAADLGKAFGEALLAKAPELPAGTQVQWAAGEAPGTPHPLPANTVPGAAAAPPPPWLVPTAGSGASSPGQPAAVPHAVAVAPPSGSWKPTSGSGTLSPKSANLAIMFTDVKDFTARTARMSRDENARLMRLLDRLMTPVVKAFGGRRVKSIGDALLVTFLSPTDAVLCGCALQDRFAIFNRVADESDRLEIRVALNLGEVRLERGDVFGDPVNVASRVEGVSEPGEIWFTEAVYLAMNKGEVPHEDLGKRELKGLPEPVRLYRVARANAGAPDDPPFGGIALKRVPGLEPPAVLLSGEPLTVGEKIARVLDRARAALRAVAVYWLARAQANKPAAAAVLAGFAVLVTLSAFGLHYRWRDDNKAERLIAEGRPDPARGILERALEQEPKSARLRLLLGRAYHRLPSKIESGVGEYEKVLELDPRALRADGEALDDLCSDLAQKGIAERAAVLLVKIGEPALPRVLKAAHAGPGLGRYNALNVVKDLHASDQIDRVASFIELATADGECEVRRRAAAALGDLGDATALTALKELQKPQPRCPALVKAAADAQKRIEAVQVRKP